MPRFAIAPVSRKRPAAPAYQPRHAFTPYIEPPAPMPHRGAVSLTVSGAVAAVVAVFTVVALGSPASGALAGATAGRVTGGAARTGVAPAHRDVDHVVSSTGLSGSVTSSVSTAAHPAATRAARTAATTQSDDLATDTSSVSSLTSDGIPVTALQAYKNAANTMSVTEPSCGIPWPLLAGIGRVESDHGRFGGAQLLTDGTSTIKILGPVLDGNGTAVIRDTDGGALDGNAQFDRAMGPMQFIPSTWLRYASDGNGDGIDDPFNIFDAALATAKYLCAAGGDLSTAAGQERAVFSYNHLTSYVVEVLSLERAYADGAGVVVPDGLGTVTGSGTGDGTTPGTTSPVSAKHPNEFSSKEASPPVWPHKSARQPSGAGSKASPPVTTPPVTTPPVTTPPVTTPPVTTPPVTTPPVTTPPVTTPPVTTPPVTTGPPATCPLGTHPIAAEGTPTTGSPTAGSTTTTSATTTSATTTSATTTSATTTTGSITTGTSTTGTSTTGTSTTGTSTPTMTAGGVPVPAGCVLDDPNAPVSTS